MAIRNPLTLVEIDVDRCPLTYGQGPCTASLSADNPAKCFNTLATCQDRANYRRTPETNLPAPTLAAVQGDTIPGGTMDRFSDAFMAFDLILGSAVSGAICEIGNASFGFYLGVTAGNLVARIGATSAADSTQTAKVAVPVAPLLNRTRTVYVGVDISAKQVSLWVWDAAGRSLQLLGSDVATGAMSIWAGVDDGAVGAVTGDGPVGEDLTDFSGTITAARFWSATTPPDMPDRFRTTLRFGPNQSGLPKGQTIFPALRSVSDRPGELNLSGLGRRSNALGRRATVAVSLEDFTYHDTLTDDYQAERVSGAAQFDSVGYDPAARGTFFGRLRARWPYYEGRPLRVLRGEVGQPLSEMRVEHYVISEYSGPDSDGAVELVAKDVLDLARRGKSQAPAVSKGKLAAAITAVSGTATLSPPGIGDLEYPAAGRICIGREVVAFTRSGDVLTLTARALGGTAAASHSAGDVAQVCLHYDGVSPAAVVRDLLVTYAGVNPDFVPFETWESDTASWLAGYALTATITRPTAITELIGEISELGIMVWWDPIAQRIRFLPNRPLEPGEVFVPLSDAQHLIEGRTKVTVQEDKRISVLQFWHGQRDVTQSGQDGGNYQKVVAAVGDEENFDQDRIVEIFCRWLGPDGNDQVATTVAERLITRYARAPLQIAGEVDIKDRAAVDLGALARITSRLMQDASGAAETRTAQIDYIKPGVASVSFRAETYDVDLRWGFIMDGSAGLPDYDTATDLERAEGAFMIDEAIGEFPDGTGPYLIF